MNEEMINVNYIIDGIITVIPTKMVYEVLEDDEMKNVHFELVYNNQFFSGSSDSTELAVMKFQKVLLPKIKIACCQSCRHGSFCPFGDSDNEVFCLKDMSPNDKNDVCDIFIKEIDHLNERSRKFLDFCSEFKPIADDYYTYNGWDYYQNL